MTADFWTWAVKAYGGEGVAAACLSLQDDHGQNVPLLLWAVWLDGPVDEALALKAAELARLWSDEVIVPLRFLRRRLKTALTEGDAAHRLPLREKIKGLELEAERALMAQLVVLENSVKFETNQNVNARTMASLRRVSGAWGEVAPDLALERLTEALIKGQFLGYDGE
ncbi:TIGR02444 family protein [Asticcacaulis benevestitus]|uniref:TIGR02444 family protein n=1 Tax=Asticcacaulis benevestitus DSM 16100 = ATCC BAA-896 TaxID=1121022 RepID=V4Q9T7_9CAUL|nr:TIGR02444 family protein [Asticcacaulis benevestitus]ESQ94600.1 hypothetical protein ABENE_00475 [Asticcacaulis benevestitus DSM 16100 = ATCC BAA-896]